MAVYELVYVLVVESQSQAYDHYRGERSATALYRDP